MNKLELLDEVKKYETHKRLLKEQLLDSIKVDVEKNDDRLELNPPLYIDCHGGIVKATAIIQEPCEFREGTNFVVEIEDVNTGKEYVSMYLGSLEINDLVKVFRNINK